MLAAWTSQATDLNPSLTPKWIGVIEITPRQKQHYELKLDYVSGFHPIFFIPPEGDLLIYNKNQLEKIKSLLPNSILVNGKDLSSWRNSHVTTNRENAIYVAGFAAQGVATAELNITPEAYLPNKFTLAIGESAIQSISRGYEELWVKWFQERWIIVFGVTLTLFLIFGFFILLKIRPAFREKDTQDPFA